MNDMSMNRTRRASASLVGMALALFGCPAMAQVALEMQASTGGPAGNGPSIASPTVTLRNNTDNPTGNAFVAYPLPLTVTYSLSNQQFTGMTTGQGFPTGTAVFFGGLPSNSTAPVASPVYSSGSATGLAPTPNSQYTSVNAPTGQGFDTTQNGGINVSASGRAMRLASIPTNARVHLADLTLTFSRPVNNPILHFLDIGAATTAGLAFAQDFELQTPGVTLASLSGNGQFSVASGLIRNSSLRPGTGCTTAGIPGAFGAAGPCGPSGRALPA